MDIRYKSYPSWKFGTSGRHAICDYSKQIINLNQVLVGSFSEIVVFEESQITLKFHKDSVWNEV